MAAAYPAHREVDIPLRDGSTLHVRPLRPDDEDALIRFFEELSPDSRAFRFFSPAVDVKKVATMLADVDYADRYGIVATVGSDAHLVAHASFARTGKAEADIAFAVADELQGKGVATIMLAHLTEAAEEIGIEVFSADVLTANHDMIEVFRESGFPVELSAGPGSIEVRLPASLSPEALARFEDRDRIAAVAAVKHVLEPGSIAVIGASRDPETVGGRVFHNLVSEEFSGPVYPVNLSAASVQAVRAYASIGEVPETVELAVIAVPAAAVNDVARECADAGVKALMVLSAGFGEVGPEGVERQRELLEICRGAGMRLVGPNCLGAVNTDPEVSMQATFAPQSPAPDGLALMTQSGALGLALIEQSLQRGLGVASFASVGNKADISGNDLLAFWEQDERTSVILLYLESFGNPRKFSRLASRIASSKPIVAVKSGRSATGARAAGSHTGALVQASDATVEALFHQAGVIRTEGLSELLDVATLLAKQPPPGGSRVGIVTNAGGPGIMCADACDAVGLDVVELPPAVRDQLGEFLPPEAAVTNPVDMIATATPDHYRRTLEAVAGSGCVDAVIAIFVRPLLVETGDVATAIDEAIATGPPDVPVVAVLMSPDTGAPPSERRAPPFDYPEAAARALGHVARHAEWRRRAREEPPGFDDLNLAAATAAVADGLAAGGGWLDERGVERLLRSFGLPLIESRTVAGTAEVATAGAEIGGRLVVKAIAPALVHKTEAGAVAIGVEVEEAEATAQKMGSRLAERGIAVEGFLVQAMAGPGVEMLVGLSHDPLFGPVVACGAGGVEAELLKDVAVRLTPLGPNEAREMLSSLMTYPRLTGWRGSTPVDVDSLVDVLLRVGRLADEHAEVIEMDLNPVFLTPAGAAIVDARVRVGEIAPPAPWPAA